MDGLFPVPIIAKIANITHNKGMEPYPLPSDEEIASACTQGKEAVTALFHRTVDQLAARIQALEEPPDQDAKTAAHTGKAQRVIQQGDIYWVPSAALDGSEPGITHPQVVIQENLFNHSRIHTVVVCALTTNRRRANAPGNVLLEAGEANLPKPSVVEVSKISSVEKAQLGEYIGSLNAQRIHQILAGIQFLQLSTEHSEIREEKKKVE